MTSAGGILPLQSLQHQRPDQEVSHKPGKGAVLLLGKASQLGFQVWREPDNQVRRLRLFHGEEGKPACTTCQCQRAEKEGRARVFRAAQNLPPYTPCWDCYTSSMKHPRNTVTSIFVTVRSSFRINNFTRNVTTQCSILLDNRRLNVTRGACYVSKPYFRRVIDKWKVWPQCSQGIQSSTST